MSESIIVNLTTGESISHEDFTVAKTGEYPQDWFQKHRNQKPSLEVPTTRTKLQDLIGLLRTLTLDQYTGKLDAEWVSNGIHIGGDSEEITPFDIYDVTTHEEVYEGKDLGGNIEVEPYIGSLLMVYRLNQLPSSVNTTELVTRFTQRFQSLYNTKPPFAFNAVCQTLSSWDSDMNYRKIVAAVDLFFEKFPTHSLSKMKFGTVSSKWRDCVALKSLLEIAPVLGFKKIQELTPWLWEPAVKTDAWRILCKRLTLNSESTGYILYMSDMGLVSRSVYSASLNPAIHVFCQTIYCATGNPRGMNARMLYPNQVRSVVRNGLMVAFALDKSHARGITLVPEQDQAQYRRFQEDFDAAIRDRDNNDEDSLQSELEDSEIASAPSTRDPIAWFSFFEATENKPAKSYVF